MHIFLMVAIIGLVSCGKEEVTDELSRAACGEGIACGNLYSEDLLDAGATTIDALRQYVLNKNTNTPFKRQKEGRGDIGDLMWGLEVVQHLHGINPIFALALSIHESGWGRSDLARNKHNLWGWNSGYCTSANRCGDSFDKATGFVTFSSGFNLVFRRIKTNYLTAGGRYYHKCDNSKRVRCVGGDSKEARACGATLAGMNCSYAEDNEWAKKVRAHMNQIARYINTHVEIEEKEPTVDSCAVE